MSPDSLPQQVLMCEQAYEQVICDWDWIPGMLENWQAGKQHQQWLCSQDHGERVVFGPRLWMVT